MLIALILLALPAVLFVANGIALGIGRAAQAKRLRRLAVISFIGWLIAVFVARAAIDDIYRRLACEQVVITEGTSVDGNWSWRAWSESCRHGEPQTHYLAFRHGGFLGTWLGTWDEVVTAYIEPVPVSVREIAPDHFLIGLAGKVGQPAGREIDVKFDPDVAIPSQRFFYRRGFRVEEN